ncbi:MAG: DUF1488 domain-containing protein [Gammaproteobacteria bacterium]|nr:DUF1488 domain-containing protein [Gammaproteobacteria bacterium]
MENKISFSGKKAWDANRDSMSFQVEVNGKKARCLISREALEDNYGADRVTINQAFDTNKNKIEAVAIKIINRGQVDKNGEYLIRSQGV